ncbi:MAG: hypothetical protein IIA08_07065 [Proteobacteria bacterium]|nr:hypothetical protein [Pseudomonadota bacterium]
MGCLFKQKWTRKDGRSGESAKWYGEYRDATGEVKRRPAVHRLDNFMPGFAEQFGQQSPHVLFIVRYQYCCHH